VGSESPAADFEILLVMRDTFKALGLEADIRLNHRGLFNRFLGRIGAAEKSVEILRAVDKLAKIGEGETGKLLAEIAGEDAGARILEFINRRGSYGEVLGALTELSGGASPESARLELLRSFMADTGTGDSFVLDPSITRGLDYYTGIVYETFLREDPSIGSVCSGGRYDNLAGLYSKERISGVGSSIGLDRLAAALESLGKMPERRGYALLAVASAGGKGQALAAQFRAAGVPCEALLEGPGDGGEAGDKGPGTGDGPGKNAKALVRQFVQAEKKGIRWVLIPGEGDLSLRDVGARQTREHLSVQDVLEIVGPRRQV
jgi:histidyl-tRNA synthetase